MEPPQPVLATLLYALAVRRRRGRRSLAMLDETSLRLRSLEEIVWVSCVCSIVVAVLLMLIRHETVAAAASLVSTGANKRKKSGLNRR